MSISVKGKYAVGGCSTRGYKGIGSGCGYAVIDNNAIKRACGDCTACLA